MLALWPRGWRLKGNRGLLGMYRGCPPFTSPWLQRCVFVSSVWGTAWGKPGRLQPRPGDERDRGESFKQTEVNVSFCSLPIYSIFPVSFALLFFKTTAYTHWLVMRLATFYQGLPFPPPLVSVSWRNFEIGHRARESEHWKTRLGEHSIYSTVVWRKGLKRWWRYTFIEAKAAGWLLAPRWPHTVWLLCGMSPALISTCTVPPDMEHTKFINTR